MCNLKICTSQQIPLYSLGIRFFLTSSDNHKDAISTAAAGRFFQVDNDLPVEQPLSVPDLALNWKASGSAKL